MPLSALFFALATIAMWSFLALFGSRLANVPPFLVVGVALSVSGLIGAVRLSLWRVPLRTLLIGVGGLFGYHTLYFAAFRLAPAVEVNIMNYLWPLLIVVLAPVYLPGKRLEAHHWLGAGLGFAGAALIISGGRMGLSGPYLPGYLCAATAALVWASYSLLTQRLPAFPTAAVGAFCLTSGILSLLLYLGESHLLGAGLYRPAPTEWLGMVLAGLGPMGLAFFTWDAALKRGDARIIGALAYLTPLTSTLILVGIGGKQLTWITALAIGLIVTGALLGSLDLIRRGKKITPQRHEDHEGF